MSSQILSASGARHRHQRGETCRCLSLTEARGNSRDLSQLSIGSLIGKLHRLMGRHRMAMVMEPEGSCCVTPSFYRRGDEPQDEVATCLKSQS